MLDSELGYYSLYVKVHSIQPLLGHDILPSHNYYNKSLSFFTIAFHLAQINCLRNWLIPLIYGTQSGNNTGVFVMFGPHFSPSLVPLQASYYTDMSNFIKCKSLTFTQLVALSTFGIFCTTLNHFMVFHCKKTSLT